MGVALLAPETAGIIRFPHLVRRIVPVAPAPPILDDVTAIAAPAIAPVSATGVIHGEVITRRWVVEMILDLVDYSPARDLSALRIVEPSAGTGAFLSAILERLIVSAFDITPTLGGLDQSIHC
jgi:hypothetical protein